jgi:hypothetical protein
MRAHLPTATAQRGSLHTPCTGRVGRLLFVYQVGVWVLAVCGSLM